jgi:hypothetical protein
VGVYSVTALNRKAKWVHVKYSSFVRQIDGVTSVREIVEVSCSLVIYIPKALVVSKQVCWAQVTQRGDGKAKPRSFSWPDIKAPLASRNA